MGFTAIDVLALGVDESEAPVMSQSPANCAACSNCLPTDKIELPPIKVGGSLDREVDELIREIEGALVLA